MPASVDKLTVAVDSWNASELNPWTLTTVSFIHGPFNNSIMKQDENGNIVALWATEYDLTDEGIRFKLNPKAMFQDGTPADAEAMKINIDAFLGDFVGVNGYERSCWNCAQWVDVVENVDVISPTELYIKTSRPFPAFMENFGGASYDLFWFGNPTQLAKGPEAYQDEQAGMGPYSVKEWDPGVRILYERWEDFWADYPWYHMPQAETLEILQVSDHPARFALLKSEQVDMVTNIPWPIAKDLVRSEDTQRGVNPDKGDIWSQTYQGGGHLQLNFPLALLERESQLPEGQVDAAGVEIIHYEFPEEFRGDPTLDVRVREALNLAIDKRTISETAHFGLSLPTGSIYSPGSFGWRDEVGFNPTPYDPQRAKELLAQAGYADGFETTGHFGQFAGRPGILEMVDAISSYWDDIGVTVTWQEHDGADYVRGIRVRGWVPLLLPTYGRQEHSGVRANDSWHSTSGYMATWDEEIDRLFFEATGGTDVAKQLAGLAALEDYVLDLKETFPLYAMSLVNGYTDRVLAHPTVEFSPHYKDLDRIVLRD